MNKQQKIVLFSGLGVVVILIVILIKLLVVDSSGEASRDDAVQAELDSLRAANEAMQLENLQRSLDSIPVIETEGLTLAADQEELLGKYNDARAQIEKLMNEVKSERAANKRLSAESQAKIRQLEGQIGELKAYCKDLLQRLHDLNEKYEQQVQINTQLSEQNRVLSETVGQTQATNKELSNKVAVAERLTLTGISLHAYNKKDKTEKNITKARKLGVSFTITPNNTAKPGMKDFYITIKTPEGQTLTGGGSFSAEGTTLQATARRSVEYANEELSTSVYWDVNTSLTPGEYTVRIFTDGQCLATRKFSMK
ncbi:MAG: hypothetical protein HDS66_06540 [Bacteroidales bacterium]|nr:hypothetical protein [Bacteroidales bacterium]